MTEDEMVGWHHRLNGHEFEQAPGVGDGQGGLACCGSWGCKLLGMTEQLNCGDLASCLPSPLYTTFQSVGFETGWICAHFLGTLFPQWEYL